MEFGLQRSSLLKGFVLSTCTSLLLMADISGIVYKDFNLDGSMNGGDTGISGVSVTAVCNDGNRSATTTNRDGNYTLSGFSEGALCRIEAFPGNAGVSSGPNAKGSAPLVDIVADGATHNISTGSPATYCQPNPDVIMAATPGWFTDDDDNRKSPSGFGSIFKVPTPAIGDFNANSTIDDKRVIIKKWDDTGAIWGAAWQKSTKTLFVSAAIKRYVPLKDESSEDLAAQSAGSIYKVDGSGTLSLFAVVPDVVSGNGKSILASRTYQHNEDKDVKELVAIEGLGDLDISEDDKYLYTINLYKKELIQIDASTGDVTSLGRIPNPYGNTCNDDKVRSWGVKVRGDSIYIGSVCEDEILSGDDPTDMSADGLGAAIQKYNVSSAVFESVAQTNTLRYLRPKGYNPKEETNYHYQFTDWSHGSYEWLPQPILTDIEFNNRGDLILGYTDRSIMIREREGSHGDIRKMCLNDDGSYTDESTERVETACKSTDIHYKDNDEVYYEFYVGDYFNGYLGEDGHPETASGALAQAPGAPNTIVGMVDGTDWWQPGSIGLYSNETGDKIAAQAVIYKEKTVDGGEREPYSGKAGGMGDVELLCDPAPIEIGNYVWMDLNEDGIQDAGEPPLSDVNVTLSCGDPAEEYGSVLTDNNGHYYFGGIDNTNLKGGKELEPYIECELTIAKSDVNDKDATTKDVNNDKNDTIDSDAAVDGDQNKIIFSTTVLNDHTLDFGIKPAFGCAKGTLFQDDGETDGILDGSDHVAPSGITVIAKDAYGNTQTAVTDDDGAYHFDKILAGTITLKIDTTDTDIPEGANWDFVAKDLNISEGTAPDGCSEQNYPYDLPAPVDQDPADVATCANPTSITWDNAEVSSQSVWDNPAVDVSKTFTTVGGDVVDVTMTIIDDEDNEYNPSGTGTDGHGAFSGPYLTLYLGDQEEHGDGNWDDSDGAGCSSHGYDLEAGESYKLKVDFSESVVLDNWRIRDVDSGDKRGDESDWEWQDGISVKAYDESENEVEVQVKIGDSGKGLVVDDNHIVHTDPETYNDGDFASGGGSSADETNGHIVLTSNFVPIKRLIITHSAGPDIPCQTRSALAMAGLAVCKPLHIAGTIYDDKDGTDQGSCRNNDEIDGEPINEIDGKVLNACLLDEDDIVVDAQAIDSDGRYDFGSYIKPNSTYQILLTTSECSIGNKAPNAELADGWNYEGETYTLSPDGKLDGLVDVEMHADSEMSIDFAINKSPTANGYNRASELNPGGAIEVDFVNTGEVSSDFINDAEQGTEIDINITRISSSYLYYDGSEVNVGDMISTPDFKLFKVDPNDGAVTASFSYKVVDQACRESNEAVFNAPFESLNVSGTLYLDKTRDGDIGGEETSKSCDDETILYVNLIDENHKVVASTTLDGTDGHYIFSDVQPGDYTLILSTTQGQSGDDAPTASLSEGCVNMDGENNPNSEDTNPDGKISIKLEDQSLDRLDFAITPTVKVGDRVWIEDDNDGDATTGNVSAASGVNISIACGNYEANTTTDSNGLYYFELPVNIGECTVKVDTPENTTPSAGSDDNSVDDVTSENDKTHDGKGTTLTVGASDNLTVDFGFANEGSWSGNVSEDTNGDGSGDVNLQNVKITLYTDSDEDGHPDNGSVVAVAYTDVEGNYLFEHLKVGSYVAVETQPDDLFSVSENEGGEDNDKVDNSLENAIAGYVDAAEVDSHNDFVEAKAAALGDTVWYDNNADGLQNNNEPGVAGVTIYLMDDEAHQVMRTVTDENGKYRFDNLDPTMTYIVKFDRNTLPKEYEVTTKNSGVADQDSDANAQGETDSLKLIPGSYDSTLDIGIHRIGATQNTPYYIGTHFWIDENENGKYDEDEAGIEGAWVELLDENAHKLYWIDEKHTGLSVHVTDWPAKMRTAEDGEYGFYIPKGSYRVHFYIPDNDEYDGYAFVEPQSNDDESKNINTVDKEGYTQVITVGPGEATYDLTLDAAIDCGCKGGSSIQSNGADAFSLLGMLGMIFMTLLSTAWFMRSEESFISERK
jgi:hypothetical protein